MRERIKPGYCCCILVSASISLNKIKNKKILIFLILFSDIHFLLNWNFSTVSDAYFFFVLTAAIWLYDDDDNHDE